MNDLATGQGIAPTLLTIKQACGYLNIGHTKLYELIRAKRVPVIRFGARSTRIPRAGLEKLASSWEGDLL